MQSDFSLTATACAAATAEILRASGASNATAVKGVGVWRALACDALARPAAWTSAIDARLADGDHRRMVAHWWRLGLDDAHWIARVAGLRPAHRVVEIGCSAGRVGSHLTRFLEPGNYGCVEPDAWSLHAQAVYELPLAGSLHKRPRLIVDEGMRLERAAPPHAALDLVVAFASMKHYIADAVIANGYCAAARLLRPGGLFLQVENVMDPSPPVKRDASRRAAASARRCGLELAYAGRGARVHHEASFDHSRPSLKQPGMGTWGLWRKPGAQQPFSASIDRVPDIDDDARFLRTAAAFESYLRATGVGTRPPALPRSRRRCPTAVYDQAHGRGGGRGRGARRRPPRSPPADASLLLEEHRRAAAGGAAGAWLLGVDDASFVIDLLRTHDAMTSKSRVLELGCGAGRVGLHLIRFLDKGKYACIESDAILLHALAAYELPLAGLMHRAPQLELRPNITSAASSHDADVVVFVDDEDRLGFSAAEQLLCGGRRRAATTLLMWRRPLDSAFAERRRLTRAGRSCGLRLVCLAPRGARDLWCAYPAPAHAPAHGWTVAVYATPDETL